MKMKLPPKRELAQLVAVLKRDIGSDYRADDDSEGPSMCLTVGWTPTTGRWGWQTGDNSFTGDAYGHPIWAVVTLTPGRDCKSREVADTIREQLEEGVQ